jgi:hypothetical protein
MISLRAWFASVLFAFAFFPCFGITIYVCFGSTSTVANSFFSSSAFFSRSGYVESTVLIHVTKPNL